MSKHSKNVEKEIQQLYLQYEKEIERIAEREFMRVIKPWLERHNYHFLSGNGTYYIFSIDLNGRDIYISENETPVTVRDILEMEIPGDSANSLGSIMPNYHT